MSEEAPRTTKRLRIPAHLARPAESKEVILARNWPVLEKCIDMIFNQESAKISYQEHFNTTYNICLGRAYEELYSRLLGTLSEKIPSFVNMIGNVDDSVFLEKVLRMWGVAKASLESVRDVFLYLDSYYVRRQKKTSILTETQRLFTDLVIRSSPDGVGERAVRILLTKIRQSRNGSGLLETMQVKELLRMFVQLGKDSVYDELFEAKFLEETSDFYSAEASRLFSQLTVPEYLSMAEKKLVEEKRIISTCMHATTLERGLAILRKELIVDYVSPLLEKDMSGVGHLLIDKRKSDLRLMYVMFKSVGHDALLPMMEKVSFFIGKEANDIVNDTGKKPLQMVIQMMNLQEEIDSLLLECFYEEKIGLGNARKVVPDCDFRDRMSREVAVVLNDEGKHFAERLSLFVDGLLRRGKHQVDEDKQVEVFQRVVRLFRHLKSKDEFETYYKKHLSRRLLTGKSASDDAESVFVSHLRAECGFAFTRKLEGMFQDVRVSTSLMKRFRNEENGVGFVDIDVNVLTTGTWPVTQGSSCALPSDVNEASTKFREFYVNAHNGRKLSWQYNMGNADLICQFLDPRSGAMRRYTLNVSTYQMCVLCLFNHHEEIEFSDMLRETQIPEKELVRHLVGLCVDRKEKTVTKILVKMGSSSQKPVKGDIFRLNEEFSSGSLKVGFSAVVMKETGEEKSATSARIAEYRQYEIDAAVVRIMKSRKHIRHSELINETVAQLQQRFLPKPHQIKKRIESLIEREYMERSEGANDEYDYIA